MSKGLKIGDEVLVISGALKGTKAKIVKVDRELNVAMLENIKIVERHMKRTQYNPKGGKKTIRLGIDLSNLKLVKAAEYAKNSAKKVDKSDKKEAGKVDKKVEKEAKKQKKGAK